MENSAEVVGTVDRVIYRNQENGFLVFVLKVSNSEVVTAKGCVPDLREGERVCLSGSWIFHPKFGRQLEVKNFSTQMPASADGIKKYLASGLIKGIGPKFAERLVQKFGENTLEIIDNNPNRLYEVDGVGPKRVEQIIQAWQDQKEISKVLVFLRGKDVPTSYAVKIFKTYGNESIQKIQENPYRLVDDIWGVGFKTADQIALKLGLPMDSPERVKAGILYSISEVTNEGNLYIELEAAKQKVTELLSLNDDFTSGLLKNALNDLYAQDKIKLISSKEKHYITLPSMYYAEIGIAKKIIRMKDGALDNERFDSKKIYDFVRTSDSRGVELNDDQQKGILECLQNKISIITGGPGTGKTTLVKKMIEVLEESRVRFKLAAPTGRAAKRMFEGTGRPTETIHRLLEFSPMTMGFTRNEQNALELEFLILDEASMIDVFLMHSILKAMPFGAHLVLIGDVDQLPSVGAGNILNDLIASGSVQVTRLTQIFRQAQDSLIIVNAHRVNNGEFPTMSIPGTKRDFVYIKEDEPEKTFELLREIYTQKLPKIGISSEDAIVLVPMNRGVVGTQRLNQELQMILNPGGEISKQVERFGQVLKVGDRVMQIRNNYDKFVFNGDLGKILDVDKEEQKMVIVFGERELIYDFSELNEITLSYAVSIHKSQGSEFAAVIIPIFMQHFILLKRNLIYTAITRAKKMCILIGQAKAIAMGVRNAKVVERVTFLKEFLTTDLQAR